MLNLWSVIAIAFFWGLALSTPLEQIAQRKTFTLDQVPIKRAIPWSGPSSMRMTFLKYGIKVPSNIEEAATGAIEPGQATASARPSRNDIQYLINVQVGNHNMSLDLDTGSSDL
jgi:aspergillopepsin I